MKHKLYNTIFTLFAICFLGTVSAQKFDKKFTENFKVNKDVEVAINASNTTINVTTWNKNEVQIDAFIEIEGLSKEEAENYFKNWDFEALGNSKTVKINSKGNNSFSLKNDFVFFDNIDFDIQIPEIEMSNIEKMVIPYLNFDFDSNFDFESLKDLEKIMKEDDKFSFQWNDGNDSISINSKKEWKAFKKTKKYKDLELKMLQERLKMKMKLLQSSQQLKQKLEKVKLEYKTIDKEKIIKELAKAREQLRKVKFSFSSYNNDIKIDGKKIKIKKRLEIKVPKGATFNLNTRHCKVKLPNTVASGAVKYGTFDALNLNGGKLKIDFSPVNINNLNGCTLFLNNVMDAKIASVTNTNLSNNSSGVHIIRINKNVTVSDKFGKLSIDSFHPNFGEFTLNVSNSDVTFVLGNVKSEFKYNINKVKLDNKRTEFLNKNNTENNLIKINGDYSTIVIK